MLSSILQNLTTRIMTDKDTTTPAIPEVPIIPEDPFATPAQPALAETPIVQPTAIDDGLAETQDDLRLAKISPEIANFLGDRSVCVFEGDPRSTLSSDVVKLQSKAGKSPKVLLIDYSRKNPH